MKSPPPRQRQVKTSGSWCSASWLLLVVFRDLVALVSWRVKENQHFLISDRFRCLVERASTIIWCLISYRGSQFEVEPVISLFKQIET